MGFDYDAIVIGAGTAGLSAGARLREAGLNYVILDKKEEVGLPVRSTGAVSTEWVRRLGMPNDRSVVSSYIKSVVFRTDRGRSISLKYDHDIGLVYDFTKYEKYLAEEFKGKLDIRMKTRVDDITGNSVKTDAGEMTAKYIIMAAGPQSSFGHRLDRHNILVGYEETRELPRRKDFDMNLWFSDKVPGGYFWDFPESENTRKIGLCYYPVSGSKPKDILSEFTESHEDMQGKCLHTMAHQIPLSKPVDVVVRDNRFYAGDMVNAVLNTTAGGLQGAFWSGKAAAEGVINGDPSRYQTTWDQEIKPWLMKHHLLFKRMNKRGSKSIGNLMLLGKLMPKSVKKRVFGGL